MKKHTTYTDVRRIMRLHSAGMNAEEISAEVYIDTGAVQHVIDVKFPKKKAKAKKAEVATEEVAA